MYLIILFSPHFSLLLLFFFCCAGKKVFEEVGLKTVTMNTGVMEFNQATLCNPALPGNAAKSSGTGISPKKNDERISQGTPPVRLPEGDGKRLSTPMAGSSGYAWMTGDSKITVHERVIAAHGGPGGPGVVRKCASPSPRRIPTPTVYHIPIGPLPSADGRSNSYDVVVEIHTTLQPTDQDPSGEEGSGNTSGVPHAPATAVVTAAGGDASAASGSGAWGARSGSSDRNLLLPSCCCGNSLRKAWYVHPGFDASDPTWIHNRLEECIAVARATADRGDYADALELLVEIQGSFESGRTDFLTPLNERHLFIQRVSQSIQEVTSEWTRSLEGERAKDAQHGSGSEKTSVAVITPPLETANGEIGRVEAPPVSSTTKTEGGNSARSRSSSPSFGSQKGSRNHRRSLGGSNSRRDTLSSSSPRKRNPIPRDPLVMQPVSMNSSLIGELSSCYDDQILGEERNEPFLQAGGDAEEERRRVKHPLKRKDDMDTSGSNSMDDLFNWVPRKKEEKEGEEDTPAADALVQRGEEKTIEKDGNEIEDKREEQKAAAHIPSPSVDNQTVNNINNSSNPDGIKLSQENDEATGRNDGDEGKGVVESGKRSRSEDEYRANAGANENSANNEEGEGRKQSIGLNTEGGVEVCGSEDRPSIQDNEIPLGEEQEYSVAIGGNAEGQEGYGNDNNRIEDIPRKEAENDEEEDEEMIRQMVENDLKRKANENIRNVGNTGHNNSSSSSSFPLAHANYVKQHQGLLSNTSPTTITSTGTYGKQEEDNRAGEIRGNEEGELSLHGAIGEDLLVTSSSSGMYRNHETGLVEVPAIPPLQYSSRPPSARPPSVPPSNHTPRGVSPSTYMSASLRGEGGIRTPPGPIPLDDVTAAEVLLHKGPARPHVSPYQTPTRGSLTSTSSVHAAGALGSIKELTKEGVSREVVQRKKKEEKEELREEKTRAEAGALDSSSSLRKKSDAEPVEVLRNGPEIRLDNSSPDPGMGEGEEGKILVEEMEVSAVIVVNGNVANLSEEEEMMPKVLEQDGPPRRLVYGTSARDGQDEERMKQREMEEEGQSGSSPEGPSHHEDKGMILHRDAEGHTNDKGEEPRRREDTDTWEDPAQEGENEEVTLTDTALDDLKRRCGKQAVYCAYPYSFPTSAGPYSASYRPIPGGSMVYANRKTPAVEPDEVVFKRRSDLYRDRSWLHSNGDKLLPPKDWLRVRRVVRSNAAEAERLPSISPSGCGSSPVEDKILSEAFREKKASSTFLLVPSKPKGPPGDSSQIAVSKSRKTSQHMTQNRHPSSHEVSNLKIHYDHADEDATSTKSSLPPFSPHCASTAAAKSGAAVRSLVSPVQSAVYGKSIDDSVLILRVVDFPAAPASSR